MQCMRTTMLSGLLFLVIKSRTLFKPVRSSSAVSYTGAALCSKEQEAFPLLCSNSMLFQLLKMYYTCVNVEYVFVTEYTLSNKLISGLQRSSNLLGNPMCQEVNDLIH